MWQRGSTGDRICLSGIGLHLALKLTAVVATAYLLARPLVHLASVGAMTAMVSGGAFASVGELQLWQVVACALVGVMGFDMFYWWAGQRWSRQIPGLLRRSARVPEERVAQAGRLMARHGFWVLTLRYFQPLPKAVLQVLAGAGGMSAKLYIAASAAGALLAVGLLVSVGWVVGEPAVAGIKLVQANAVKATIGILVIVGVWQWWKHRRARAGAGAGAGG